MSFNCIWCHKQVFEEKPDVESIKVGETVCCPECGKFLYGKTSLGKQIKREKIPVFNLVHHTILFDKAKREELGEAEVIKRLIPAMVHLSEVRKIGKKRKKKLQYVKVKGKAKIPVDLINHPPHYLKGGIEAIDVIEAWDLPFNLGNVIKYICRAGNKHGEEPMQDLKKAKCYLDRYIKKEDK